MSIYRPELNREAFTRAMSRFILHTDDTTKLIYLGVTPDGENPGRLRLSGLRMLNGEEEIPYESTTDGASVKLEGGCGTVEMALALPNRLIIRGRGVSLLLDSGTDSGALMGGGSAVKDAVSDALLVLAGARLRIFMRRGSAEIRSQWDLEALKDPDPRVYLHPDDRGEFEAVVFESDFDEIFTDDGTALEAAAEDTRADFEAFLKSVGTSDERYLAAAYTLWAAKQPARLLSEQRITNPEYISDRLGAGVAMLGDSTLAAVAMDGKAAAERLCSFLDYMTPPGLVPKAANNRIFLMETETPYYGAALHALMEMPGFDAARAPYDKLKKAAEWWLEERYCPERKMFYYLHRYESGHAACTIFAKSQPVFAPDINAVMALWLDAMSALAEKLERQDDAARYDGLAKATVSSMLERLWDGERFCVMGMDDKKQACGSLRCCLPVILGHRLPESVMTALLRQLREGGAFDSADGLLSEERGSRYFREGVPGLGASDPALTAAIAVGLKIQGLNADAARIAGKLSGRGNASPVTAAAAMLAARRAL